MLLISKFVISRINFFKPTKSKTFFIVPLSIKSHPTYPYV